MWSSTGESGDQGFAPPYPQAGQREALSAPISSPLRPAQWRIPQKAAAGLALLLALLVDGLPSCKGPGAGPAFTG